MTIADRNFDGITSDDMVGTLGAKWNTYPGCIGAWVAEMDYGTAPEVKAVLTDVVEQGQFGYLPKFRDDELAKAVADWYARNTPWKVTAEMVRSMPDVLTGLEIVLTKYAPRGGKVILPTPAYMPFFLVPGFCGREIVEVPMTRTGYGWEYDYDAIEQAFQDGGEVLIFCNPHNPIGKVALPQEMERLGEIVERHDGRVFSDEIHAPLVFSGQQHVPYAAVNDRNAGHTLTSVAASKAWNLPGLKCAQMILSNQDDIDHWESSGAAWTAHGASSFGVVASSTAWSEGDPWLRDVMAYLEVNRDRLEDLVAEHLPGVTYYKPQGTYLAWLDFTATKVPENVGEFFRERAQVAITDGAACGEVAKRCVRFNFAMSHDMQEQAISRMGAALKSLDDDDAAQL